MYKNFVKYNRHTRDSSIIKKELVQRLYKKGVNNSHHVLGKRNVEEEDSWRDSY